MGFYGGLFPAFPQVASSPTSIFNFHLSFPKPLIFLVFTPFYLDNHHEIKPCFSPILSNKFIQNPITTGHWLSINFAVFHTIIFWSMGLTSKIVSGIICIVELIIQSALMQIILIPYRANYIIYSLDNICLVTMC